MERYKASQGSLTRLVTWMVLILGAALGCVELYAWIQSPGDASLIPLAWFRKLPFFAVPFSWKFVFCVALFGALVAFVRWYMGRRATTETLVETELEMKKVSWPTRDESFNAMWVVVLVTVALTATLAAFDGALHVLLKFIF